MTLACRKMPALLLYTFSSWIVRTILHVSPGEDKMALEGDVYKVHLIALIIFPF